MISYQSRERLQHGTPDRPWKIYALKPVGTLLFPCHWHPEWELLTVDTGAMRLTRGGRELTLEAGRSLLLTGAELHMGAALSPDTRVRALVFHPGVLSGDARQSGQQTLVEPLLAGTLAAEPWGTNHPATRWVPPCFEAAAGSGDAAALAFRGLVHLVIADLAQSGAFAPRPARPRDPAPGLCRVLDVIDRRFADALTVEELAAEAGLSPSHFGRQFRAVTGESPITALVRRRVQVAAALIAEGRTVSEAALEVGFHHFSYFSRAFRRFQGRLPSQAKPGASHPVVYSGP